LTLTSTIIEHFGQFKQLANEKRKLLSTVTMKMEQRSRVTTFIAAIIYMSSIVNGGELQLVVIENDTVRLDGCALPSAYRRNDSELQLSNIERGVGMLVLKNFNENDIGTYRCRGNYDENTTDHTVRVHMIDGISTRCSVSGLSVNETYVYDPYVHSKPEFRLRMQINCTNGRIFAALNSSTEQSNSDKKLWLQKIGHLRCYDKSKQSTNNDRNLFYESFVTTPMRDENNVTTHDKFVVDRLLSDADINIKKLQCEYGYRFDLMTEDDPEYDYDNNGNIELLYGTIDPLTNTRAWQKTYSIRLSVTAS